MSKKLIAVASAAALALAGLVGIAPANASAPVIGYTASVPGSTTGTQTGATAATAITVPVPARNILVTAGGGSAAVTADTSRTIRTTNIAAGDTVTVTTTGGVKLLEEVTGYGTASLNFNIANVGATSFTKVFTSSNLPSGNNLDLVFFTTTTETGSASIALTRTGLSTSKTFYFKGVAGEAHSISGLTGIPTSLAKDATATISFKVTDVFGNAVEARQVSTSSFYTMAPANATIAKATGTDDNGFDSSSKTYKMTLTGTNSDPFVFSMDLDLPVAAAGLAAAADTASAVVNNPAVAAQFATLTAQVAALQVIVDRKVSKKRYNTLARKWNAANPSSKVKLKK